MAKPDFLRMKCTNTELPNCAVCGKEFFVPLDAVEMVCKDGDKALFLVKGSLAYPDPSCPMNGQANRFIETEMSWTNVIALLNGGALDLGDIKLKTFDYYK